MWHSSNGKTKNIFWDTVSILVYFAQKLKIKRRRSLKLFWLCPWFNDKTILWSHQQAKELANLSFQERLNLIIKQRQLLWITLLVENRLRSNNKIKSQKIKIKSQLVVSRRKKQNSYQSRRTKVPKSPRRSEIIFRITIKNLSLERQDRRIIPHK